MAPYDSTPARKRASTSSLETRWLRGARYAPLDNVIFVDFRLCYRCFKLSCQECPHYRGHEPS